MRAKRSVSFLVEIAPPKLSLAVLSLVCLVAHAENLPLSLSVSETLSRDSNLYRVQPTEYSIADTVSSTGLRVGLDKSYGRQRYTASMATYLNRYFEETKLDNTSYDLNVGLSSEFGSAGYGTLNAISQQKLARFDIAGAGTARPDKNTQNINQIGAQFAYGLYAPLSINAGVSHFDQSFTETSPYYQNSNNNTISTGLSYSPIGQLTFGTGLRFTKGNVDYDQTAGNGISIDSRRRDLDFTLSWKATGLSFFSSRVSATQEKDQYANATLKDSKYKSVTGAVSWAYTPQGRLSTNINFTRDIGNTGRQSEESHSYAIFGQTLSYTNQISQENNKLTNTLDGRVSWELSSKITLNATGEYSRYSSKLNTIYDQCIENDCTSESGKSRYTSVGLGFNYVPRRWVSLYCDIKRYKRTKDIEYNPFNSMVTACTGQFNINGMN